MLDRLRNWRRRRALRTHAIPAPRWQRLCASVPLLHAFEPVEQHRLHELASIFLFEKTFHGVRGAVVTDQQRELIAGFAAVPILGLDSDWYGGFVEVIVYPAEFRSRHEVADEAGVVHVMDKVLSGESWQQGPVILSLADVEDSLELDGYNVVLHELAHKIDMRNGDANGMPPLHHDLDPAAWTRAFRTAFDTLRAELDAGREPLVDPYAAEGPDEFFAVFTEAFFECPREVRDEYPEVYAQLRAFYRQDPALRSRLYP
ncbi:MAG: zinc-dependent peptidase [Gammaproteobacteria bacterium]|nr:zinc-dependent peptidase [Gammaproteobacteria bacterium]